MNIGDGPCSRRARQTILSFSLDTTGTSAELAPYSRASWNHASLIGETPTGQRQ